MLWRARIHFLISMTDIVWIEFVGFEFKKVPLDFPNVPKNTLCGVFLMDWTTNEIAVIMGVKRASLCVLKNRTLNHLRDEMKKCLGGD